MSYLIVALCSLVNIVEKQGIDAYGHRHKKEHCHSGSVSMEKIVRWHSDTQHNTCYDEDNHHHTLYATNILSVVRKCHQTST